MWDEQPRWIAHKQARKAGGRLTLLKRLGHAALPRTATLESPVPLLQVEHGTSLLAG